MRLGVDEAGTGLAARLLNLGMASGVTLAIMRKGRVLCWTVLGVLFLAGRTLGPEFSGAESSPASGGR